MGAGAAAFESERHKHTSIEAVFENERRKLLGVEAILEGERRTAVKAEAVASASLKDAVAGGERLAPKTRMRDVASTGADASEAEAGYRCEHRVPGRVSDGSPEPLGLTLDGAGQMSRFIPRMPRPSSFAFSTPRAKPRSSACACLPGPAMFFTAISKGSRPGSAMACAPMAPTPRRKATGSIQPSFWPTLTRSRWTGRSPFRRRMLDFQLDANGDFRARRHRQRALHAESDRDGAGPGRPSGPARSGPGLKPSSTSCMFAASPSCTRLVPEALRGTFAGLAHPAASRIWPSLA